MPMNTFTLKRGSLWVWGEIGCEFQFSAGQVHCCLPISAAFEVCYPILAWKDGGMWAHVTGMPLNLLFLSYFMQTLVHLPVWALPCVNPLQIDDKVKLTLRAREQWLAQNQPTRISTAQLLMAGWPGYMPASLGSLEPIFPATACRTCRTGIGNWPLF